jgi:hypothetical protein
MRFLTASGEAKPERAILARRSTGCRYPEGVPLTERINADRPISEEYYELRGQY